MLALYQEDYHVADLRKELGNLRKLLADERRRSICEGQKLLEVQGQFGQALKEYSGLVDNVKQLTHEKRSKVEVTYFFKIKK